MSLSKRMIVVCLLLAAGRSLAGNYIDDPEEGMRIATIDYQNGNYEEAYKKFKSLADMYSLDGHGSVFRFMAAKSLYKAAEYNGAITLFDRFVDEFPRSRYAGAAILFKGHCYYKQGDFFGAASAYITAIDLDLRGQSAETAENNLDPLVTRGLSMAQLRRLIDEHPSSFIREKMELNLAQRQVNSKRYRSGASTLNSYLRKFPYGKYSKRARGMLDECRANLTGSQVIGLMAPITGSFSEYGRSMVEGARLAIKHLSADSVSVELIIKDTKGDPVQATKVAATLAGEEAVAIVGPLRSECAVGAAVTLNQNEIPMITPTASQDGIASIGNYIFQISPAIEGIGQAIASYAINDLGITDFAIISPDDMGGMTVSRAFTQTVYRLGGEVVYTSYYTSGETDFKRQIKPLREFLLMNTEEQLAAGEIDSSAYVENVELDEMHPDYADSVTLKDKDDWPVNLGALFLPGYAEDLKLLIPQIRYHIIHTQFLGSDGWDSEDLIREVKRYVGKAVFATDFHAGSDEVGWVEFSNAFSSEYGHQPDKVAALTFDAVALILSGLNQGYNEPEKLRDYLGGIKEYPGVSCLITFRDNGRANNEVRIYSIDGNKVARAE